MSTTGQLLRSISQLIDSEPRNAARDPQAQLFARVGKVCEESGEVFAALIAATGANPRKHEPGSLDEVERELFDVAVGALLAIAHLHTRTPQDQHTDLIEELEDRIRAVARLYEIDPASGRPTHP